MINASSQAPRIPSPMSSSAIKIEPRAQAGFEAMSLPYNNEWAPDHRHRQYQYHHPPHGSHHPHPADPSQPGPSPGPRLPSPGSLITGAPIALPPQPPSPSPSTPQLQHRPSASASPHGARRPSFPPQNANAAFAGQGRDVASQHGGHTPSHGLQGAYIPPPAAAGAGFSGPHDARLFQGRPPTTSPRPDVRTPSRRDRTASRTDLPSLDERPGRPQTSSSSSSAPPPPPPPNQGQQPHPPPKAPASSRQPADWSPIPGMPNLVGAGRAQALSDIKFRLTLRQQPKAARACGFGDRDRRVIDPPPIVQLIVESPHMTEEEIRSYLRFESYVMNCSICDETGTRDASFMPEEYQHQRRLMGSLVGTPFVGQDEHGEEGCFFCFSDLSCRTPGSFRLKFTLIMIDPLRAGVIRHFPMLTEITSDVFHVYSAKEFPGMVASSSLAKKLKEQGCIISIKKGNERAKNARSQDDVSDMDDDDGETTQGQRKRRILGD
ncbi:hypothetical protein RJ55_01271 [Drechmeria coniospora]|nr:hypothetical protein RJ55_01271 [Drechmeria coniospora]